MVLIFPPAASGWPSHNGRQTLGHMDDFHALTQQLYEGRLLLQEIEAGLFCLGASQEIHLQQVSGGENRNKVSVVNRVLR